jgi:PPOX class probable F420-dependent enzyme
LAAPHIGAFTTVRPDGSVHTAPVRFTWDGPASLARVMTVDSRVKAQNIIANPGSRVSICQAPGYQWLTLEGIAAVLSDPARVDEGKRRYARRYLTPPPPVPGMVVIEIAVDRVMGLW